MNSFIENVNYVAGLDNLYGSGIELYKNNLSLKSVQHDIELKFSYYNNDDKKIHCIVYSEPGVLVGGINDTLLSFKTLVESSITGSEFTCTVSSSVQDFVINNIVMVNINITSHSDTYKTYEMEMKVVTAGAVTYDVFGEVKDSLKILPSLATITSSDVDAMVKVYEIQEEVTTVSENILNVETVSDSIANVNITGTNITNVNIVGDDIANVNTVSTHISNVDTVSQGITNVNTVSSNIVDVGIASTNIASINTVANAKNLADIIRVADDLNSLDVNGIADITIVANDLVLGVNSNIITVSESIDNVNITGNNIGNVNTVVTDIANIDIVSTNIANVNITATDISSVNNVSSNIADVNTVSDGITNVNTVSGSIDNVNTVASNIVGLNSIVSNMTEILLADNNAAIATTKALESSDSAESSLQSAIDSAASAALFPNHIADTTNPHEVTKSQVGLEFAENTADIDKVVASAGKLTSAVNISLSGDASGSISFDGSGDADIVVSIDNDSHTHAFGNITGKPDTLDGYGITDSYTKTEVQTILPKVGFDTTNVVVPGIGQVAWNQDENTLDLGLNGAVLQVGQEQLIRVRNNTVSTITNGSAVMATGTIGNSGRITIANANLTQANAKYILGIVTETIANGADGFVTAFGKVRGIQTNGVNYGETWVDGDVLYVKDSGNGVLTKVVPTDTQVKLPVAIVISAHGSNGTLFVRVNSIDENHAKAELALKANLISPTLVTPVLGVATGTSFNSITGLSSTFPVINGVATIGTSTEVAKADHIHPSDTTKVTKVASTNKAIVRFNGITGEVQNSNVIIGDSGNLIFERGSGTVAIDLNTTTPNGVCPAIRWGDTTNGQVAYIRASFTTGLMFGRGWGPIDLILDTFGNLLLTSGTGGLGYGAGAGGTVTQLTSKSTDVTLNKPSGRIMTASDALASGATVYFTLNNSLLSVGDILVVNNSGWVTYNIECRVVSDGLAYIHITNTGSIQSQAIPIYFNIIKGATA